VSATFHGRDIFAPVASNLSLGTPPQDFGDEIDTLFTFPMPRPKMGEDGVLIGHILHIDRFGNLITDIRREDLPKGNLFIDVAGHFIESLSPSYAEGEELLAIIGSSGRLEVSLKNGNAAALLRAKVGSLVRISSLGK
ncbi:MAG: S-adenosyl-l-methionine hydroxide adenosyltransferase, partial [Dehalococcoidia bacterium]